MLPYLSVGITASLATLAVWKQLGGHEVMVDISISKEV
jgi:hypothetical protein